jgi:hypothetical protein
MRRKRNISHYTVTIDGKDFTTKDYAEAIALYEIATEEDEKILTVVRR